MTDKVLINRATVEQALEALYAAERFAGHETYPAEEVSSAITALRAALAQAEPVQPAIPLENSREARQAIEAMLAEYDHPTNPNNAARAGWRAARLYNAPPPQQQAEPLTEEEIDGLMQSIGLVTPSHPRNIGAAARARRRIARAVEAMLAVREAK